MQRVFGKRNEQPRPGLNDAIQSVEGRGESIGRKIAKLDDDFKKVRDQMSNMRDGPSKDVVRQRALRILKQKRMYEEQNDQLHQQMFNMDQTNFAIMGMKDNQITYAAMKDGLKVMKKEYKKLDVDKIEQLQDQMADMLEMNNEVNQAFSCNYAVPDIDEAELDAELAAIVDDIDIGETDTSYMDAILGAPDVSKNVIAPEAPMTIKDANGIEIDEFGLPKVPNQMLN